jgi:hypothetical protein
MDADGFDSLARSLVASGSRRRALGGLLAGPLGLLGVRSKEAAAHDPRKACKKKSGEAKRKCLKKAKKHNAQHASQTPSPDPCASCTGDQVCTGGQCVVPACGAGGPCLLFLSSVLYTGNLKGTAASGLAGADAKCQGLADAAGLPGTYKAWLSDSTSSPASRFVRSTGPYRLVNGTTIAGEWGGLTDGVLRAPINVTETGGGIGGSEHVWTGTKIDGNPDDEHCGNWSSAATGEGVVGSATKLDAGWTKRTNDSDDGCDARHHLYCFQQR